MYTLPRKIQQTRYIPTHVIFSIFIFIFLSLSYSSSLIYNALFIILIILAHTSLFSSSLFLFFNNIIMTHWSLYLLDLYVHTYIHMRNVTLYIILYNRKHLPTHMYIYQMYPLTYSLILYCTVRQTHSLRHFSCCYISAVVCNPFLSHSW